MPIYIFYPSGGFELTQGHLFVQATGGNCITGSASYSFTKTYISTFVATQTAYVKSKAQEGLLRPVFIKKVFFVNDLDTCGQTIPLYIDSYNSYWNDELLVDQTTAIYLIQNYLATQAAFGYELAKETNPCLP